MDPCEAELYNNLSAAFGPALAATFGKAIMEGLRFAPEGSVCVMSQAMGTMARDMAESLVSGINGLTGASVGMGWILWGFVIGAMICAYFAPRIVHTTVYWMGFREAGVERRTLAAAIMAWYGGNIVVGSLCSILQSIGASGLGLLGSTLTRLAGFVIGGIVGAAMGGIAGAKFAWTS
ncbi:MAG: hypothetical protein J3Q66DRAFT_341434 [Benniella sp.]|nr:MAG: hypothetical protein J3Q66DRAFT_341434 [Benniella sp.]